MADSIRVLVHCCVWPEPESSAAGLHVLNIVDACRSNGWKVTCSAPGEIREPALRLERERSVRCERALPNRDEYDELLKELAPDIVIFERFISEERFGWRVREGRPEALRVVATSDFASLRRAREVGVERGLEVVSVSALDFNWEEAAGEVLHRELASLHRSDLAWVVSPVERDLLVDRLGLAGERVEVFPFAYEPPAPAAPFEARCHFAMIGNFRHPPNTDSVLWTRREIWPLLRGLLPEAELHVYGAYPPRELMALDDPASGFRVLGPARDAVQTLSRYRVALAPLRYGAGIKGKVADAWRAGTPVVGTPIAFEGMCGLETPGGVSACEPAALSRAAAGLHEDAAAWKASSDAGTCTIRQNFSAKVVLPAIAADLRGRLLHREELRSRNRVGAVLWHQTLRSTEYFSRWIALKEKSAELPGDPLREGLGFVIRE